MVRSKQSGKKKGQQGRARSADIPGQTLNVDLCFVPVTHTSERKLPAVSGSSGRLVVERLPDEPEAEKY